MKFPNRFINFPTYSVRKALTFFEQMHLILFDFVLLFTFDKQGIKKTFRVSSDRIQILKVRQLSGNNANGSIGEIDVAIFHVLSFGGLVTESVSYEPDNENIDYKDGVEYGYDLSHPHAVNELDSVEKYQYDANGSMTSRNVDGTTYSMDYDPENRLTSISGGTLTARYVFDGDGRRVLSLVGDTRTLYVNEYFEVTMENGSESQPGPDHRTG